jgi:hypothetical protein
MLIRIKYYFLFILPGILLFLSGCESFLEDNKSPNNPSEVPAENILPSGLSSVGYVMGGKYQVLGGLWAQHWTQSPGASQYSGIDSYDVNSSSFDDRQFGELYTGALMNLEKVKLMAQEHQDWGYYLISTVMQCYTFQILADLYGKIPFYDVLEGESGETTPLYAKGDVVYDSLIARLDYALSLDLEAETVSEIDDEDIIFNGDLDRWTEFANSLKMKIYLRQCYAKPQVSKVGLSEMWGNEAGFLNTDVLLNVYADDPGNRNPLYSSEVMAFGGNYNLILSRTLHSFLSDHNDIDRLNAMFDLPENGGTHKSLIQGDYNAPDEDPGINSAFYSKPVFDASYPVFLMSAAEVYFMRAEAIIRFDLDNWQEARNMYEMGIQMAFDRYGLPNAEYFINNQYSFPAEGAEFEKFLELIITQKWLSMVNFQSLEAFFEHNRTGFPKVSEVKADDNDYEPGQFTVSVNNVTSGRFPKRLIFPKSEYDRNPNTPAVKAVWENVWWDMN